MLGKKVARVTVSLYTDTVVHTRAVLLCSSLLVQQLLSDFGVGRGGGGGGEAGEGFSNGVFVMVMLRKVTTAKSNPDAE